MNKKEIAIVVVLFALLLGWSVLQNVYRRPARPQEPVSAAAADVPSAAAPAATNRASPAAPVLAAVPVSPPAAVEPEPVEPLAEERRVTLTNGVMAITLSSRRGAIVAVEFKKYPQTLARDSASVVLDFAARPALAFEGLAGVSRAGDFEIGALPAAGLARIAKRTESGLRLERTLKLSDGYRMQVTDVFHNDGAQAVELPEYAVAMGPMHMLDARAETRGGVSHLGIDTLPDQGGARVRHWAESDLPGFFGTKTGFSCQRADASSLPPEVQRRAAMPVAWAAVKNRFFVQLLTPQDGGSDCELQAERDMAKPAQFAITGVSAAVRVPARIVPAGGSVTREMQYYVGPKQYDALKKLGQRQSDVMQFGWTGGFFGWFGAILGWLCPALLWMLNVLHAAIPNYGIAIILLTFIVKVIFWPVTHKSTESMKKMQAVQPLLAELKLKHKDNPQKLQRETMALYKEHKVNPLSGCLPILVQIPVFIALFTVLRSAVELRFAGFLWIRDLSEPENIALGSLLPFLHGPFTGLLAFPVNIWPLLMTATTIWQQHLTPSMGDPQQQKMMMFMPIVMLFLFYNMASALVVYWTVSQVLSIVQLLWQKRTAPAGPGGKGGVAAAAGRRATPA